MSKWGYYSLGISGYEMKIDDDGEHVIWLYVGSTREQITHRAKIYYTSKGRSYFIANGRRIYLDECIRTDIGKEVN